MGLNILFGFCFFGFPMILHISCVVIMFFSFKREQKERVRVFNELKSKASDCLKEVTKASERIEKDMQNELTKISSTGKRVSKTKIPKQELISKKRKREEIYNDLL